MPENGSFEAYITNVMLTRGWVAKSSTSWRPTYEDQASIWHEFVVLSPVHKRNVPGRDLPIQVKP